MKKKGREVLAYLKDVFIEFENVENKLKASNQQLAANEQQLKAANQQLDAFNQQLQASEQLLKESNQQLLDQAQKLSILAAVVKDSNDAVIIHDLEGNITEWNAGATKIYGYSEQEALKKNMTDLAPEEYKAEVLNFIAGLKKGELVELLETKRKTKDGKILDVWVVVTKLVDKDGKLIGVATTERDITEQNKVKKELYEHRKNLEKQVEERTIKLKRTNEKLEAEIAERKQAEKAIRKSEKQLNSLINAMPDYVCFKDGDGRWLKLNDAGIRIFQLESIDYYGKKDSELAKLNSELQSSFLTCKESDARAWNKGSLIREEETLTYSDGSVRVFDVTKVPVIQPSGKREGLIVIGHDITERKKADEELRKKIIELEIFNDATVDREIMINELRKEINELYRKLGNEPKYDIVE